MARPWADLTPDLLIHVADHLIDLKSYVSARGACNSWRRALALPFPALLFATEGDTMPLSRPPSDTIFPDTIFLERKSFDPAAITSSCCCVGSSNGWLAICSRVRRVSVESADDDYGLYYTAFFLVNPVTGAQIALPPLLYESRWISKVVFTPCPDKDDYAAVAIYNGDRIIYVTAGDTSWVVLPFGTIPGGDYLTDLVYHGEGKVYCLNRSGDVHILHLPERRRRRQEPAIVDQGLKLSVVLRRSPKGIQVWEPNYLDLGISITMIDPHCKLSVESSHLNATVSVEPLLSADSDSFSPATAFAPPYHVVSAIIGAKNLVFCEGNLYQVWRNMSCTVNLRVPPGVGRHRVSSGEVLVLRYYPERRPCWDVVKDLGGYSFFIGKNNAVSLYAQGMPGIRANCVYWIDGKKGIIFDVGTGRSTPCRPPAAAAPGYKRTLSLWYFYERCGDH